MTMRVEYMSEMTVAEIELNKHSCIFYDFPLSFAVGLEPCDQFYLMVRS